MNAPPDAGAFGAHPMDAWIPHRGRMRLVDQVAHCDAERIECIAIVRHDGLFTGAAGMPAWIGIELMAQAAAAWAGARAREAGGGPRGGFLVGSRRYDALEPLFPIGAALRVACTCAAAGDNGLRLFDCRIAHDGRTLATGRLSVLEAARPEGA